MVSRTPEEYNARITERLNWFEKLADDATGLDERLDVANRLLMEILKYISVGQPAPYPIPQIPYRIIEFDLSTERVAPGELVNITGNTITAITDGTLEGIGIRLNSQGSDLILFSECNPYAYIPGFTQLYLQNTAQAGKTLKLYLGTAGAVASIELTSVTFAIDVVSQSVGSIAIDITAQTIGALAINVDASEIMMPIDVQGAYIMLPVDIQAQYVTLEMDIVAQTVGAISVDLTAQSIGNIGVTINAQNIGALDFNIIAQSVALNVKISDLEVGLLSVTDWATKELDDLHLQGSTAALAAAATITLITLTLASNKEHWLYTLHISGTEPGLGKCRANKTSGYDELAWGYFPANDGYIKNWGAPVMRRQISGDGVTEVIVTVTNNGASAGDFCATLDGIKVVDESLGEDIYTLEADWAGCSEDSQIDTAISSGDVLLALH